MVPEIIPITRLGADAVYLADIHPARSGLLQSVVEPDLPHPAHEGGECPALLHLQDNGNPEVGLLGAAKMSQSTVHAAKNGEILTDIHMEDIGGTGSKLGHPMEFHQTKRDTVFCSFIL